MSEQRAGESWKVERLRIFGYGFKWMLLFYDSKGNIIRQVSCQSDEHGFGIWVAGVKVNTTSSLRGISAMTARKRIVALFETNPKWLEISNRWADKKAGTL